MRYAELVPKVLRSDLSQPGFVLQRLDPDIDSQALRRSMVEAREAIHSVSPSRYLWLNRFDHQVSSRPHQDNAPGSSVLILGYEQSPLASRVRVVDLARFAHDRGESTSAALAHLQALTPDAEGHALRPYTTELGVMDGPCILVLDNSEQGVMHGADISPATEPGMRVVNSMMLVLGPGEPILDERAEEAWFLERDCLDG